MPWFITKKISVGKDVQAITADKRGNVYFVTSSCIGRIDTTDQIQTLWKSDSPILKCSHVVWGPKNYLYLQERNSKLIEAFSIDYLSFHNYVGACNSSTPISYSQSIRYFVPKKIAFDTTGRIHVLSQNGLLKATNDVLDYIQTGSQFLGFKELTITEDDTIYLNPNHGRNIHVLKEGKMTHLLSGREVKDGHFNKVRVDKPKFLVSHKSCLFFFDWSEDYIRAIRKIDLHKQLLTTILPLSSIKRMIVDAFGNIWVYRDEQLYQIQESWNYERFLWLAWLKEDANYCYLASLPRDIIREIVCFGRSHIFSSNLLD